MPELPEVETIVRDLQKSIINQKIEDVWSDNKKVIKKPKSFEQFRKEIKGKKIEKVWRRGKNIIFNLSENKALLIHQKLTGHLLVGQWILDNGCWKSKIKGPLQEKVNTYIHLLFTLNNGQMLALSDLRKFAKAELWDRKKLEKELSSLGPEPLKENFTFKMFQESFQGKKGKIKQVLMDQKVIAGIGNIYSDEILFKAKIHPFKNTSELNQLELKKIYSAIKGILKKAIKLQGTSISDFRNIRGRPGSFNKIRKVYRREGEKCKRCGIIIQRVKIGGRSAHFCPKCQNNL